MNFTNIQEKGRNVWMKRRKGDRLKKNPGRLARYDIKLIWEIWPEWKEKKIT